MKKALTLDCPSCKLVEINDDNKFQCNWGKAKRRKILENPKSAAKRCGLIRK